LGTGLKGNISTGSRQNHPPSSYTSL